MSPELAAELLSAAVRLAVPVLLAALGEILAERAGVVNVGVEGMMLVGCLVAVLARLASGSSACGIAAGALAGALLAALFAALVVWAGGDGVVTGTGLNLLALGGTGFIYQLSFGRTGSAVAVPLLPLLPLPGLAAIPVLGKSLFTQPVTAYLAVAAAAAVGLFLSSTGAGLRVRAAGDAPRAAAAAGASVAWLRTGALLAGGLLAGLGGAALALGHAGTFVTGMTAGRGFLALALVICARRSAWGALPVSLLFGAAAALPFELQALGSSQPYQFARAAPYVLALVVLALTARREPALGR